MLQADEAAAVRMCYKPQTAVEIWFRVFPRIAVWSVSVKLRSHSLILFVGPIISRAGRVREAFGPSSRNSSVDDEVGRPAVLWIR